MLARSESATTTWKWFRHQTLPCRINFIIFTKDFSELSQIIKIENEELKKPRVADSATYISCNFVQERKKKFKRSLDYPAEFFMSRLIAPTHSSNTDGSRFTVVGWNAMNSLKSGESSYFITPYRACWWSNPLTHLCSTFPIWFKGLLTTCKLTRASQSMTPRCQFEALMSFPIVEQFLWILHTHFLAASMSIRHLRKFWWSTWQF